jgi:hypothetical protein
MDTIQSLDYEVRIYKRVPDEGTFYLGLKDEGLELNKKTLTELPH